MQNKIENIDDWNCLFQAAENGNVAAQEEVAMHYHFGLEIKELKIVVADPKKAVYWTKVAMENGSLEAMLNYANYLSEDDAIFCEKDVDKAISLYEMAIRRGSKAASFNLGCLYRDLGDFTKAFALYVYTDADANDEEAWPDIRIGLCYYYGIGVEKDRLKALQYFKKMVLGKREMLSGYEFNELNYLIGKMYLEGEIVEQSLEMARYHIELADEDGDHRSAQELLYLIGRSKRN